MAKLLEVRGIGQTGMPVNVAPGQQAHNDIGWPYSVRTIPEPVTAGTTDPLLAGGIVLTADGSATVCNFEGQPIVGNENSLAFRMNADGFTDHAPMTTYSISFLYQIGGVMQLADMRRFFTVMEGTTIRWGIGLTGKPISPFESDSVAHRLILVEGANTERARSNVDYGRLYENTWYRFEVEVKPTAPKITVRVYSWNSTTKVWTNQSAVLGLSYSPTSVSANRLRFGIPSDAVSSFNSTIPWKLADVQAWDTVNADGNFPAYQVTQAPIQVNNWNGTTETTGGVMKLWNGAAEQDITADLNWEYGQRFRPNEIYYPYVTDPGNTLYGTDDDNQRYLVLKPPGTPPPGGWPYGIWVTTNYFTSGDYLGALQYHGDMLRNLLRMGVAVVSTGVRLANIDGSGWHFPQPILDAKLAARHLQANRTDLNHSKRIAMGHSSGGYISLSALMSRNMTDNGNGVNMTLNGNGYGGGAGSDPDYIGSLTFSPAIDFPTTWANDPTFPHLAGYGGARLAITAFLGQSMDSNPPDMAGVSPHEWVPLNLANQRPAFVHGSSGDSVVPKHNGITLRDTLIANGVTNAVFEDIGLTTHPEVTAQFTSKWVPWLKALIS